MAKWSEHFPHWWVGKRGMFRVCVCVCVCVTPLIISCVAWIQSPATLQQESHPTIIWLVQKRTSLAYQDTKCISCNKKYNMRIILVVILVLKMPLRKRYVGADPGYSDTLPLFYYPRGTIRNNDDLCCQKRAILHKFNSHANANHVIHKSNTDWIKSYKRRLSRWRLICICALEWLRLEKKQGHTT